MIKVGSGVFKDAFGRVAKAVDSSPLNSILDSVLLETDGDRLLLTGSDGQVEVATECKLKTSPKDKPLAFAVKSAKLGSIIQFSGAKDEIAFKLEKNVARLSIGRAKYALSLRDGSAYPKLNAAKKPDFEVALDAAQLKVTLKRLQSAISTLTHRINLAGAYFDFNGEDGLALVATDGHRMVVDELAAPGAPKASFILPRKAVLELIRLLELGASKQAVLRTERQGESFRQASFELGSVILTAQLIPDEYPAYGRVIPDEKVNSSVIAIKRDEFLNSVRQACAVHDKPGDVVEIIAQDKSNSLEIVAKGTSEEDSAELDVSIGAKTDAIHCKLNSGYLQDMLNAFEGFDSIDMAFKNGKEKLLFTPKGSKSSLKYVVMPVR